MTESPDKKPEAASTAIAERAPERAPLIAGAGVAPIIPRTIEEVARVARAVIVAKLAPESYKGASDEETASKIMIGIMKGAEIGLPPLTALANIVIVNNRPSVWGDAAVALIQASGKVESWTENFIGTENTDGFTAVCDIKRKGQTESYTGRFSIGEAKQARLLSKGPWVAYPKRMLMWRARTYAMRNGFADCLMGLSIAEEMQDVPAKAAVTNMEFLDDDTQAKPDAAAPDGEAQDAAARQEARMM